MDLEHARYLLVEQQIRPWNVLDSKVLDRVLALKREDFVPADKKALAFVDTELPLPCGGQMLSPKVEARFVQEAQLKPTDKVLVIGAASGAYLIGLAAGLCAQVYGSDDTAEKVAFAQAGVQRAGIKNVRIEQTSDLLGFNAQAPYDAIIVCGSFDVLPAALKELLASGGRVLGIVGELPIMRAVRVSAGAGAEETLFEYNLPRLQPARSVFAL
ncbi:protein-L-isoaspartate O-methyltransferase [Jeongeupia sp. HS-3]|uniref:protein-L-isoaspartate O-methyltransferase family protein n=1 Tax=Jeongeupia sp. HS-3 TaxID=1009682 RepID=UPI0018A61CA0|nr:protein-L-isoaspartate O-methyltransferase [Jeongeupia sp. HS-3]BCL76531.1 protein-L-isoaspartate O-methyltransferase [Jeongeupia sp. HS-3]